MWQEQNGVMVNTQTNARMSKMEYDWKSTQGILPKDTAATTSPETGWGMDGYGGVALGAGQLGLGIASYLENQKTADKQRQVMDQQISSNNFALGTAKARQGDISNVFGKKPIGA